MRAGLELSYNRRLLAESRRPGIQRQSDAVDTKCLSALRARHDLAVPVRTDPKCLSLYSRPQRWGLPPSGLHRCRTMGSSCEPSVPAPWILIPLCAASDIWSEDSGAFSSLNETFQLSLFPCLFSFVHQMSPQTNSISSQNGSFPHFQPL